MSKTTKDVDADVAFLEQGFVLRENEDKINICYTICCPWGVAAPGLVEHVFDK